MSPSISKKRQTIESVCDMFAQIPYSTLCNALNKGVGGGFLYLQRGVEVITLGSRTPGWSPLFSVILKLNQ